MNLFRTRAKHLIVTTLIIFTTIVFVSSPIRTFAAATGYDPFMRDGGEEMSMRSWTKSLILGAGEDISLCMLCGCENDKEKVWVEGSPASCMPPLNQITERMGGDNPRILGGLGSMSGAIIHYGISEPAVPTDMALFLDNTFGKNIFTGQSYAQTATRTDWSSPTAFFQASTFTLWRTMRNISLGLLGVLLAVAGLSILFRSKLSPQVTVTVANVLPYLPLSIIGIVLSYPIMAVAYNLMFPLMSIAWSIGSAVVSEITQGTIDTSKGAYSIVAAAIITVLSVSNWYGDSGSLGVTLVMSLPIIVVILVAGFLIEVSLFRFVYEYAKTVILFVFYVVAFPLLSAIAILPGKQNLFSLLFKKILANLLALPIMTIFVLVGLGFIASMGLANTGGINGAVGQNIQYISITGGIFSGLIRFGIGWGIIWQSFKARSLLEDAFGAGGSLMSTFKGGGGESKGGPGGKR